MSTQPSTGLEASPLADAYWFLRQRIHNSRGIDHLVLWGAAAFIGLVLLLHARRRDRQGAPRAHPTVPLAVTLEAVPGKGWVAHAAEVRATAQGGTEAEALDNLRDLLNSYPESLEEIRVGRRHIELVTV